MSPWKDISSAPKGRKIMLCSVAEDMETGVFDYFDGPYVGKHLIGNLFVWPGEGTPTHWSEPPRPPHKEP